MESVEKFKQEIEAVLQKTVPKFYRSVYITKGAFGGDYIAIKIACSTYEINQVRGQMPQLVSLVLDLGTFELSPQVFGGSGGQSIYRQPNMDDPKEKYLAMKSVKVPFRKPSKDEVSILKAIEKFAQNYKKTLKDNLETLRYKDIVDYNDLLGETMATGGEVSGFEYSIGGL